MSEYQSAYKDKINEILGGIENTPDFKYDPTQDLAYQSLSKSYGKMGNDAMRETLASTAGLTGGMPSSYAVSAASQAKNSFNEKLGAQMPALMDAAYGKYMDGINIKQSMLNNYTNVDNNEYSKYNDQRTYDRGVTESDRNYNRGVTESDRNYSYQKAMDDRAYNQWLSEYRWNTTQKKTTTQKKGNTTYSWGY